MASNILPKQTGITYHQLGNTITPEQAYRISQAAWIAIRSLAPSWNTGPAASKISHAKIERQRQDFITANGFDGLHHD